MIGPYGGDEFRALCEAYREAPAAEAEAALLRLQAFCQRSAASVRTGHWNHGLCRTPEYRIYQHMLRRCHTPTDASYDRYGGRGIVVCDRWRGDFLTFYADMGPRPSPKHSIDRIDNDGDYSPENCRWVTQHFQVRNYSRNRMLTIDGERLPAKDAAIRAGLKPGTVFSRLERGWSPEDVLKPRMKRGPRSQD